MSIGCATSIYAQFEACQSHMMLFPLNLASLVPAETLLRSWVVMRSEAVSRTSSRKWRFRIYSRHDMELLCLLPPTYVCEPRSMPWRPSN